MESLLFLLATTVQRERDAKLTESPLQQGKEAGIYSWICKADEHIHRNPPTREFDHAYEESFASEKERIKLRRN